MTARLTDDTIIQVSPETFTKASGNQLYILTYSSEEIYIIEETGYDIWNMIQESPLTFSNLCIQCKNKYEAFDKSKVLWLKEFLVDLHKNELITFST